MSGWYAFKCYGSAGGFGYATSNITQNGYGGYTNGELHLEAGTQLYVYVGQQAPGTYSGASWNGGGASPVGHSVAHKGGAGGGASDIRLQRAASDTDWQSTLGSRIIVGAGGGGAVNTCSTGNTPGHGGGLQGKSSVNINYHSMSGKAYAIGGTQTAGGYGNALGEDSYGGPVGVGSFGTGGTYATCCGGGGGGWFGGGSGYVAGGSGGSSYAAGYPGCNTAYLSGQQTLARSLGFELDLRNIVMTQGTWNSEGFVNIVLIEMDDTSFV